MTTLPLRLDGFLRALCAIANGTYSEGGMSIRHQAVNSPPPPFPPNVRSNDATMEEFFGIALGVGVHRLGVTDHVVQELRRVLRDDTGSELTEIQVENDPGECWSSLFLRWAAQGTFHTVELFWSLD